MLQNNFKLEEFSLIPSLLQSPMKRRHPLAIVVPNPDEPLPRPGVAYSQPGPSNLQPRDYPITHKASQSSANTSIGIEVVPPVSWSFVLILVFSLTFYIYL
jgi:hypothetical protein